MICLLCAQHLKKNLTFEELLFFEKGGELTLFSLLLKF